MKAILTYFAPANRTVITKSGYSYYNTQPEEKSKREIEGCTEIKIFESFHNLNNSLRYCNGTYYEFEDKDLRNKYKQWLLSDDYKSRSFELYYGNGIVD